MSLKASLLYGYITMLMILTLAFAVSLYTDQMLSSQRRRIDQTNLNLSHISLEIRNFNDYLDLFISQQQKDSVDNYKKSRANIKILLEEIREELSENEETDMYNRILNNLLEYESNLVRQILIRNERDLKTYDMMVEYKRLTSYMIQYSNLLINVYLEHGTRKHQLLTRDYVRMKTFMNASFIFIGILLFIYIGKAVRNATTILTNFSNTARNISNGQFHVEDISENSYQELNTLAAAFNQMKKDIKDYIEQMKEKAALENRLNEEKLKSAKIDKLYKESQFLSLQNQINPHFLFNTLNTIKLTAMFGNIDETMGLVDSIGKILRYNLSKKSKLVPLQDEVSVLKSYIHIQSTRFQDQISFELSIQEDIDMNKVYIPPMTIQPLVENAIKHGFRETEKGGLIRINIKESKAYIHVFVEDNGQGMRAKAVKDIFKEGNPNVDLGIGLMNIKNRLEIIFDKGDLLKVESEVGKGTTIIVLLPKERSIHV